MFSKFLKKNSRLFNKNKKRKHKPTQTRKQYDNDNENSILTVVYKDRRKNNRWKQAFAFSGRAVLRLTVRAY